MQTMRNDYTYREESVSHVNRFHGVRRVRNVQTQPVNKRLILNRLNWFKLHRAFVNSVEYKIMYTRLETVYQRLQVFEPTWRLVLILAESHLILWIAIKNCHGIAVDAIFHFRFLITKLANFSVWIFGVNALNSNCELGKV